MPQRTDQLTRSRAEDGDVTQTRSSGRRSRLKSRATDVFSPKFFLLALVASAVGLAAGGFVVPFVSGLGGVVGVFIAAFALGLLASDRRYLEVGAAGAALTALATLSDYLVLSVAGGFGLSVVAIGAVGGLVAALLGHYFGRDLRAGLTRSV